MTARPAFSTIAWGLFCACSWTWGIGMYLPRVMLEQFGPMGFIVFAVPNVLGAAAVGYVVASRRASVAMVDDHGPAMFVFSLAAVAFSLYFVSFLLGDLVEATVHAPGVGLLVTVVIYGLGLSLVSLSDRTWLALSVATWVGSAAAFAVIGIDAWPRVLEAGSGRGDLAWFAPVIVVGFIACPYLDLSFHRARQQAESRHAFAVFGVAFTVMILLTCFLWFAPGSVIVPVALAHLLGQSVFTVGVHLREAWRSPVVRCRDRRRVLLLVPLAAAAIHPGLGLVTDDPAAGEDTYLRLMGLYALVFPAYVLVFVGPWRPLPRTRTTLVAAATVVVVLAPLYELAFIHGVAWTMAIPVAVLALWGVCRLLVRRAGEPSDPRT